MASPRPRSSPASIDLADSRKDPVLPVILEFRSPSAAVVSAPVPRFAQGTVWLVTSLFVAIIVAAGGIRVDQEVTAQGEVISKSPTLVVQPLDTSIVRSIDVHVGETVHAGQVLGRLDPTFATADLSALTAQTASLDALVRRLQAEAGGGPFAYSGHDAALALQAAIFAARQSEYNYKLQSFQQTIDELTKEISRANSDAAAFGQRLALAQSVEAMRRQLATLGVGSKLDLLAALDNRAEMQRDYANASQTTQAAQHSLAAEVAQRNEYVQSWRADVSQQLSGALGNLSDAQANLRKAELHHRLVELRAERDGTVLTVAKISVGSVVQSGEQLFTLMPAATQLEVETNIEGGEAGYARVGDPVAIKFATFPFARYGLAYGTLRTISANSFTGQDTQQNQANAVPLPFGDAAPYYSARITLDRIALHGTPAGFHLVPGMPVEVDIVVGRHSVLQYLLQQVLQVTNQAMREPG